MDILERKHALAAGLSTYYTGKLCRNGHLTYRYTGSGSCSQCVNGVRDVDLRTREKLSEVEITKRADERRAREADAKARHDADAVLRAQVVEQRKLEAERQARRKVGKAQLAEFWLLPPAVTWEEYMPVIMALTQLRCPELEQTDIFPRGLNPIKNGTLPIMLYREDWQTVRKAQEARGSQLTALAHAAYVATIPHAIQLSEVAGLRAASTRPALFNLSRYEGGIEFLNGHWYSRVKLDGLMSREYATPVLLQLERSDIEHICGYDDDRNPPKWWNYGKPGVMEASRTDDAHVLILGMPFVVDEVIAVTKGKSNVAIAKDY